MEKLQIDEKKIKKGTVRGRVSLVWKRGLLILDLVLMVFSVLELEPTFFDESFWI